MQRIARGNLLDLRGCHLVMPEKREAQRLALSDKLLHLVDFDPKPRSSHLTNGLIKRHPAVQCSARTDNAVAAEHARFHELAVGKSYDERNDPAVREIQVADGVRSFAPSSNYLAQ